MDAVAAWALPVLVLLTGQGAGFCAGDAAQLKGGDCPRDQLQIDQIRFRPLQMTTAACVSLFSACPDKSALAVLEVTWWLCQTLPVLSPPIFWDRGRPFRMLQILQWVRASAFHFLCCFSCTTWPLPCLRHSHFQLLGWCWPLLVGSGYQGGCISSLFLEQEWVFLLVFFCRFLNSL